MKVLAIDPGERVGWARGEVDAGGVKVEAHGISFLKDFAVKLFDSYQNYDLVIYEKYRITKTKLHVHVGSDVPTLQLVGMIRLLSWRHTKTKLVGQTPTNKNTSLEKLIPHHYPELAKILAGLPKTHDDSHDGDAIAHLAYYHFHKEHAGG